MIQRQTFIYSIFIFSLFFLPLISLSSSMKLYDEYLFPRTSRFPRSHKKGHPRVDAAGQLVDKPRLDACAGLDDAEG